MLRSSHKGTIYYSLFQLKEKTVSVFYVFKGVNLHKEIHFERFFVKKEETSHHCEVSSQSISTWY